MAIKKILALILSGSLVAASSPMGLADQGQQAQGAPAPVVKQTPQQLDQLVAPIALYPDELVGEVLAAATYPEQVVEADRWLQDHKSLQGQQLANEIDKQPWDSSVKALTEFPSVLANMDKNLSWTSSLGDVYMNQQPDVMNAVQVMRQRAEQTGNLKSNAQQNVSEQGGTITVEPVSTDVVYVPTYDPWIVYGPPVVAWPGWYSYPGLYVASPGISFGIGFGLGSFTGVGWGWHHWGCDWGHGTVIVNHTTYISHSTTIINRNAFYNRNNLSHGRQGFAGAPHGVTPGTRSGAFSGYDHGAVSRSYSYSGRTSVRGVHGVEFHGGGRRR